MKRPIIATYAGLILAATFPSFADESIEEIPINKEHLTKLNKAIEVQGENESLTLSLTRSDKERGKISLFEIQNPPTSEEGYAIAGEIAYQNVTKQGYLEMWNHLPLKKGSDVQGAAFFSRTLAPAGPLKALNGNEEWRPFILPAFIDDGSGRTPLKLEINAILPKGGSIQLRNLRLLPHVDPAAFGQSSSKAQLAILPILIGGLLFIIAAALTGWLLVRKRQRSRELEQIRALDSV